MNPFARFLQDLLYWFFNGLIRLLGGINSPRKSYAIAQVLGNLRTRFGYIGAGWSRQKYLGTIKAVFPEIETKQAESFLRSYWINHQKKFVELFIARQLTPQNLNKLVEFEGLEHLDRGLEKGNGVIMPVPHIGNERLHHIALAVKGYPMAVISSHYEDHGPFARKIKLEAAKRFHEVGHPGDTRWLLKVLKQNSVLQVASDAEADANAVLVEFLNQQLFLPTGWVRLAQKTGAPVFPSTLLRKKDDHHILMIKPEFNLVKGEDDKVDLKGSVQQYMKIISEIFVENPDLIDWMSLTVRLDETQRALDSDAKASL